MMILKHYPREAIESLQLRRLQQTVERVYATVPFYRETFDRMGVKPKDIRHLTICSAFPLP
jgi:phenylacetate-CoA ligase